MAKLNPVEMQKYLKGVDYPADREALLKKAKENDADDETYSVLEQLPDEEFESPAEVSKAIGEIV